MIWFTSDQHFGHKNIIKYCNRPFSNVDEMDQVIVRKFNSIVSPNDTTYHLGDFCFQSGCEFLSRLHGKHILIKGNHDRVISPRWAEVHDVLMIKKHLIWLSHYAHLSWPQAHYGAFHCFGHSHGTLTTNLPNSMDVGVDAHDFFPVSINQILGKRIHKGR